MKPAVIAIQFIVLLFTTPLHANSCECTISSPIILDDALSVKRFADLVRSTCAENAMAIRLEKGLYIQTANISDESLSSIPKALRVISIGENLSINRTKLVEFPLFLSELSAVGDASAINPADIVIKNNHLLTAIHLHKYNCSTQHNLIVENNNSLQHLHIPSSILDIKHISVSDNKSLTSLSAMNFNSANSIDIVNNPKLEDIEFISASLSIHSHLRIENNSSPHFVELDISNLTGYPYSTIPSITILDNYFLKTLSGPLPSQHLTKIHSLIIQGNKENLSQNSPRLNRLSGFSSIIEISEQLVLSSINANNSELSLGIGKNLKTVNNIFILDNNEITNLDWLNQLSHIEGELYIKFNKSLNKCDLNLIPIYQPHHSKNISNNGKQCNTLGKQTPQRT